MAKTSRISFFLFVFFYNYLWLRIIIFPRFYNEFGTTGFIMSILLLLGIGMILLLIPKKIITKDYKEEYQKSFYKWFHLIIILLETIFSICYISYFINKVFIIDSNIYVLLLIMGIVIIFVSNLLPNEIIDISTLFHLLGLILVFVSLFFTPKIEIEYLFMDDKINIFSIVLYVILIISDNFKLLINKNKLNIKKSTFIFPILISIILFILEYGFLIMTAGDNTLSGLSYVGFLELSFMPVTKYFGDFNFVYIYLLLICGVFKNSYNISLIKNSTNINKRVFNIISVVLLALSSVLFINTTSIDQELYKYVIIAILAGISIFWMIGKCYFVRKG